MSEQEKITYMQIALGIQKLGGDFSLKDAVKIEMDIREKYAKKSLEANNVDKNS